MIYSCSKEDNITPLKTFRTTFSANKTTGMGYDYDGVIEQNGRLVFDDLPTYHAVLDSLAKNDSTYFANNPEPDLVDANGFNIVGENPLLDDFENAFSNFTSHRKDIEIQEVNTLNSGSTNLPERLWLDPFISTTLNEDLEIQIGTTIIKFLDGCRRLVILNEDQLALDRYNNAPLNYSYTLDANLIMHNDCHKLIFEHECIPFFDFDFGTSSQLAVNFYNNSLTPITGNITYSWDFGDGNTSNNPNPTHNYSSPGNYVVCLTLSGPNCSDFICRSVTIGSPSCEAKWNHQVINENGDVIFNSTPVPSSAPYTFLWEFGDGNTSSFTNPFHTYGQSGSFDVCLTVTNTVTGCIDKKCTKILVGVTPEGNCCKANDKDKIQSLNSSITRLRTSVVQVANAGIISLHRVSSSTRHYKWSSFLHIWFKKRIDHIEVDRFGQVWVHDIDGVPCNQAVQLFSDPQINLNRSVVNFDTPFSDNVIQVQVKSNELHGLHATVPNAFSPPIEETHIADCN